ncbi:MAG: DUF2232 domain-containing protein [Actinobacteria bacterium]|nr:DUF2232 domain-containing protein [Actinomycetota bacterium]MBL7123960.1 DUF2232 domain-containing protein [Actinomycetota bacterium]
MSFDNLKNIKIERLNLALLTLFTFLSLVFTIFVPFLGIVGLALLPVPATLLILCGRIRDGTICAVIACIVLILLDYIIAPVAVILIIAVSFIYRNSISKDKSKLFTVSGIFLVFCGAALLYIILVSAIGRINFVSELFSSYNSYIDGMSANQFISGYAGLLSVDQSQFDLILKQTQNILRFIPYIAPGILIVSFVIVSVINYVATSAVLRRYNINIKPFLSFNELDLPWYYCWGAILGLVLVLVPSTGQNFDKLVDIIGFNLIIIFGLLYLVLGISVLWGILERFKVPFIWRISIFIILGLFFGFAILILPFLGLIDIWVNFRRLKRG